MSSAITLCGLPGNRSLDAFFLHNQRQAERQKPFLGWVRDDYDAATLRRNFHANRRASFINDWVLAHEQRQPAMDAADVLQTLPITARHGPFDPALRHQALTMLEHGKVLVFPDLPFPVAPDEADLLRPDVSGAARKNVSLDPRTGRLGNTALPPDQAARLIAMVRRFADHAARLLADLLPSYAPALAQARTSFRPNEIAGRNYAPRHDDRRLHVDPFPSRPMTGRRILRLFSNVAPDGAARAWRVGEPLEPYARRFLPRVGTPLPGSVWLLSGSASPRAGAAPTTI